MLEATIPGCTSQEGVSSNIQPEILYPVWHLGSQNETDLILQLAEVQAQLEAFKLQTPKRLSILDAVISGDMNALNLAIAAGDLHETREDGMTPLHVATLKNDHAMMGILLEHGADVYRKDNKGRLPLHLSIFNPKPNFETYLILKEKTTDIHPCVFTPPDETFDPCDYRDVMIRLLDLVEDRPKPEVDLFKQFPFLKFLKLTSAEQRDFIQGCLRTPYLERVLEVYSDSNEILFYLAALGISIDLKHSILPGYKAYSRISSTPSWRGTHDANTYATCRDLVYLAFQTGGGRSFENTTIFADTCYRFQDPAICHMFLQVGADPNYGGPGPSEPYWRFPVWNLYNVLGVRQYTAVSKTDALACIRILAEAGASLKHNNHHGLPKEIQEVINEIEASLPSKQKVKP